MGSGHRLTGSGSLRACREAKDLGFWPQTDRFPIPSGAVRGAKEVGIWMKTDMFWYIRGRQGS